MRRLFSLGLFVLCVGIGFLFSSAGRSRDIFRSICDLTAVNFYKDTPEFREWLDACTSSAARVPRFTPANELLNLMQDQMDALNISHFSVFSPADDRKLWKGESATDTGLRARYIDGHLVIYRVLPRSAGARAGFRVGDDVVALPGVEHPSPWGVEHRSGDFTFRRSGQTRRLAVRAAPLQIDESPKLSARDGGREGLLEIQSFRAEFFEAEAWRAMVRRFAQFARLTVDLRENAGGNFVAMLRALSTFTCHAGRSLGEIVQPRHAGEIKDGFDDDLDDQHQLGELDRYHRLRLRTFASYGCFSGPLKVLISAQTASVAEIFADALSRRPNTRVWGQPTAGDVVLAVWFDLPALGPGYSVSIPAAVFVNSNGLELEGRGVRPQREVYYDLKRALAGEDSYL